MNTPPLLPRKGSQDHDNLDDTHSNPTDFFENANLETFFTCSSESLLWNQQSLLARPVVSENLSIPGLFSNDSQHNPQITSEYQHLESVSSILDVPVDTSFSSSELCHPDVLNSCSYILIPLTTPGIPQYDLLTMYVPQIAIDTVHNFQLPRHALPHKCLKLPLHSSQASSLLFKLSPALVHSLLFTSVRGVLTGVQSSLDRAIPLSSITVRRLIDQEFGWVNYLGGERIILPPLPLLFTAEQLRIMLTNVDDISSSPLFMHFTQQLLQDIQLSHKWVESLAVEDQSDDKRTKNYYFIPVHMFRVFFLPYALFLREMFQKHQQLTFSQLIPFALPPPYFPQDSIALFHSFFPLVAAPETQTDLAPFTPVVTDASASPAIIEPCTTLDVDLFQNTPNSRFNVSLIFQPLDFYRGDMLIPNIGLSASPPLCLSASRVGSLSSNPISSPHHKPTFPTSQMPSETTTLHSYWSRVFVPHCPSLSSPLLMKWSGYNIKHFVCSPQCGVMNRHGVFVFPQPLQHAIQILAGQLGSGPIYTTDSLHPFSVGQTDAAPETTLNLIAPTASTLQTTTSDTCWWRVLYRFTHSFNASLLTRPAIIPEMISAFINTMQRSPSLTPEHFFEQPFRDLLQVPLQPLGHQLENATYEVFERDPVKYRQYRLALEQHFVLLYQSLLDKHAAWCSFHGTSSDFCGDSYLQFQPYLDVCVLGAGRGPLITCCIEAAANTGVPIRLFAVEKNPFAFVSLLQTVQHHGGTGDGSCTHHQCVDGPSIEHPFSDGTACNCSIDHRANWSHLTLVESDMRSIIERSCSSSHDLPAHFPTRFHVVVSELLGSFGDNELSPECLWDIQKILTSPHDDTVQCDDANSSDVISQMIQSDPILAGQEVPSKELFNYLMKSIQGVSLPNFYRSWIAPVVASQAYNQILSHNFVFSKSGSSSPVASLEEFSAKQAQQNKLLHTPYVVMLHNHCVLAPPCPAFSFSHPHISVPAPNLQNGDPLWVTSNHQLFMDHPLARFCSITFSFPANESVLIHGFSGYFETILFDSTSNRQQTLTGFDSVIGYSILPDTYSHGMFSWFPFFFPLQVPLLLSPLPAGSVDQKHQVVFYLWRKCDHKRVWYEYACQEQKGLVHNLGGIASSIGL